MQKRRNTVRLVVEYHNEEFYLVSWRTSNDKIFKSITEFVKGLEDSIYKSDLRKWKVRITPVNTRKLKNRGFRFIGDAYFIANNVVLPSVKEGNKPPRKKIETEFNKELRQYQIEGAEMLLGLKGMGLLADPPGAGKSAQASLYVGVAKPLPAIIICPAGLKEHWARELKRWAGLSSFICEGRTPGRPVKADCYIINYDILTYWMEYLLKLEPRITISDECQYLIDPGSIRSICVSKLAEKTGKFIGISGTPIKNRAREFFTVLSILDPGTFNNYDAYLNRYCDPQNGFFGVSWNGTTNASELHNLISSYTIRRKKIDILPELPPLQRICIPLNLTNYKKISMIENKLNDDELTKKEAEELYSNIFEQKAQAVFEWIDIWLDSNPGEKLVIAAYHIYVLQALLDRYKKTSLYIDGGVAGKKRQAIVDKFNEDDTHRLLLLQVIAGGVGFSAHRANTIAIVEMWYVPGDLEQVENRIHRANSKGDHFTAYYLVGSNTIEERILDQVNKKQRDLGVVLDGEEREFLNRRKKR